MISRWNPTCSTSLLPCLWHNVGKEIVYSVAIIILLTKVGTVCHLHLNSFVPCIKNLTVTASCVFLFCSVHFYQYVKHVLKISLYSLLQPTKLDLLVQIMPLKVLALLHCLFAASLLLSTSDCKNISCEWIRNDVTLMWQSRRRRACARGDRSLCKNWNCCYPAGTTLRKRASLHSRYASLTLMPTTWRDTSQPTQIIISEHLT